MCVCVCSICAEGRVRGNVRFLEKEILIRLELPPKSTKIKYESIMHGIIANGMQMGPGLANCGRNLGYRGNWEKCPLAQSHSPEEVAGESRAWVLGLAG